MLGNTGSELLKIESLKVCTPVLLCFEQHLHLQGEGLAQLLLPSLFVPEIMVIPVCVQFFMLREH